MTPKAMLAGMSGSGQASPAEGGDRPKTPNAFKAGAKFDKFGCGMKDQLLKD